MTEDECRHYSREEIDKICEVAAKETAEHYKKWINKMLWVGTNPMGIIRKVRNVSYGIGMDYIELEFTIKLLTRADTNKIRKLYEK